MPDRPQSSTEDQILAALRERAKELNCLYEVDEVLSHSDQPLDQVLLQLIDVLPPGWQYPEICRGAITLEDHVCVPSEYIDSPWKMSADIELFDVRVGEVTVYYTEERLTLDEGPFLKEERRLINAIADRISLYLMQQRTREVHDQWESALRSMADGGNQPWQILLDFLKQTDPNLLKRITRKMINHMCWSGIQEGPILLQESIEETPTLEIMDGETNRPLEKRRIEDISAMSGKTFSIASKYLGEADIIAHIQSWINEEKSTFLVKSLENPGSGVADMTEAIERFQNAKIDEPSLSVAVQTSLKVALIRRFFVDSLEFINIAKQHVRISDFFDLSRHLVYPRRSQGKLGGKGAGLFLATRIIRNAAEHADLLSNVKSPKTWYVVSDALLEFIHHNELDEVYNRKYLDVDRIRQDYPHIVQVFKNSHFTREIRKGLAAALDDLGEVPLIVRSSSLLEDRAGSAFSGKYKSLFLANQGTKEQRLNALQDAIAEVYASVFGPDPIEYRAERGLLDFREEMGILIQEVVGKHVGKYFVPAFSGVAFSNNEFRWSPRIRREDGLIRLVPGLGTRAVDRLADDYPVLISPGQPGLRANVTVDEKVRYSPRKIDVINLERNAFETIDVVGLLREHGDAFPAGRRMISIIDETRVRPPSALEPDWRQDDFIVTFEGETNQGRFVEQMHVLLNLLREKIGRPVDIEFACDGEDLYIVQCRAQSRSEEFTPDAIPRDIPRKSMLFSASRHISNGHVPDITHVVYVDPEAYASLSSHQHLRDVGRAISRLNAVLPKRQFILIGPGRWGSRGDIKLGVSVTYSDINNTALLLEVAKQKGNYVPELSFGTHFFQDLVESGIRYIPLYPDQDGTVFNERFLTRSPNMLHQLAPEFTHLEEVVHVIDIQNVTDGKVVRVLLNADLDEAVGLFSTPSADARQARPLMTSSIEASNEDHWRWRLQMAEQIADRLDPDVYDVRALYVIGSTKNATAGPGSDIDLIIHDRGPGEQRELLIRWLAGWSEALAEINFFRTGYRSEGLLDLHFVTDRDIEEHSSYAAKIDAVTDAARPLRLKHRKNNRATRSYHLGTKADSAKDA